MKTEKRTSLLYNLTLLTIVLTNITQIPDLIDNSSIKLMSYVPWILLAVLTISLSGKNGGYIFGDQLYIFFLAIGFLIVCGLIEINGNDGFGVCLLRPLLMCVFVYVVSMNVAPHIDEQKLNNLLVAYIVSSVVVTFFVYRTMLSNGFDWTSKVYAYDSKNSVSQIILTALIFLVFLHGKKNLFQDVLIDCCIVGLTVSLFMLKSRASILGIVVIVISVILSSSYSKLTRFMVSLLMLIFIAIIISNSDFRNFLINNIMLAGRDSTDLDSISSGRWGMIEEFPYLFSKKPFLGYGSYYLECMQLDAFIETGVVGGAFINVIAIAPIVYSIKHYRSQKNSVDFLLMIISMCYYINGFFEQLAPFGPGVKCYFMWFLFGLSVAWRLNDGNKSVMDY